MAYTKQPVQAGDVMDPAWGNHVQTQYEEAILTMNGGQIVEKGSNADGSYVRWENGLQVCFINADIEGDGGKAYEYDTKPLPKNFSGTPTVLVTAYNNYNAHSANSGSARTYGRASGTTYWAGAHFDGSSGIPAGNYVHIQIIVIGWWK